MCQEGTNKDVTMWDILSDTRGGGFFYTRKASKRIKNVLTEMSHMWNILSDTPWGSFLHTYWYQYQEFYFKCQEGIDKDVTHVGHFV